MKNILLFFLSILLALTSCKPNESACVPVDPNLKTRSGYVHHFKKLDESSFQFCLDIEPGKCYTLNIDTRKFTSISSDFLNKTADDSINRETNAEKINHSKTMVLLNKFDSDEIIELRTFPEKKIIHTIKPGDRDTLYAAAEFMNNTIFVTTANCAGPCTIGSFYSSATGKFISTLGGKDFNIDGTTPIQIDGNLYAFNSGYGEELVFQDIETGGIQNRIDLREFIPKSEEGYLLYNPMMTSMIKLSDSTLALIYSTTNAGDTIIVDIPERKIRDRILPPICK